MVKESWTITEALELFEVDEHFLVRLEEEEIICFQCGEEGHERTYSFTEMEKVRIARLLTEELGVNLSGVEIILQMRQQMIAMRTQFDAILEDLAERLSERHG